MIKKVLILSYSNLASDPRVLRQINVLQKEFHIIEGGRQPSGYGNPFVLLKEIQSFHIDYPYLLKKGLSFFFKIYREYILLRLFKNYERYYWDFLKKNLLKKIISFCPDIIIANDIEALPLAVLIKKKSRDKISIIFDAHEYAPLQITNLEYWKKYVSPYKLYLSKKYIPLSDYCFTVSKGIAEAYEDLSGKSFILFKNSPEFLNLSPSKVEPNKIKLIHHGAAIQGRNLDLMFDLIELLDSRFILNLILIPTDLNYYKKLIERASNYNNIIIHEPVPTSNIPAFINQFDLGVFLLPPNNFNYKHALPNKFFEFVQARLGVIIGPSLEMVPYVKEYDLGIVSGDFSPKSAALLLNELDSEQIRKFKNNSHIAAEELSVNNDLKRFLDIIKST